MGKPRENVPWREALAERKCGAEFFRALSSTDRGVIGDQLVLGDFDWRDWFEAKPSRAFLNGLDAERIMWEMESHHA